MAEPTEPLAVYDVHEDGWPPPDLEAFNGWLRAHDIDPLDTYRVEIWQTDHLFTRVFQFLRDHGELYCPLAHSHEPGPCVVAKRPPFDVPLTSLPPGMAQP